MPYIEWEQSFSVGLPEFDAHHRHLFELLNKAYNACMLSKQGDVFSRVLSELSEYACYHFTAEERMMEECAYPALDSHRDEHIQFTRKTGEFRKILAGGNEECMIEMVELTQFLIDWLKHHILEVDRQYSQLLGTIQVS